MDQVGVFIDYENMHRVGHSQYAEVGQQTYETVLNPLSVSQRIVDSRKFGGELKVVRVYRGRPLPQFQPEATSANDALESAWSTDGIDVVRRDLKYTVDDLGNWRAQEKGIDVALAIGAVESAMRKEVDVVILFSNDTDQLPTLELLFHRLEVRAEIACWSNAKPLWFPEMLRAQPPRRLPFCHFLGESDFLACRDLRGMPADR